MGLGFTNTTVFQAWKTADCPIGQCHVSEGLESATLTVGATCLPNLLGGLVTYRLVADRVMKGTLPAKVISLQDLLLRRERQLVGAGARKLLL
jgi:hypothetical protein